MAERVRFSDIAIAGEGAAGRAKRDRLEAWDATPASEGLYYFNARWYDPGTGRFLSEDPVLDGTLWFAYVANNPMGYVDVSGLYIVSVSKQYYQQKQPGNANATYPQQEYGFRSKKTIYDLGCRLTAYTRIANDIQAQTSELYQRSAYAGRDRSLSPGDVDATAEDQGLYELGPQKNNVWNNLTVENAEILLEVLTDQEVAVNQEAGTSAELRERIQSLAADPDVKVYVVAQIETYSLSDPTVQYTHYVNITGVDANGAPIIADTSTPRDRTTLDDQETLVGLEIVEYE